MLRPPSALPTRPAPSLSSLSTLAALKPFMASRSRRDVCARHSTVNTPASVSFLRSLAATPAVCAAARSALAERGRLAARCSASDRYTALKSRGAAVRPPQRPGELKRATRRSTLPSRAQTLQQPSAACLQQRDGQGARQRVLLHVLVALSLLLVGCGIFACGLHGAQLSLCCV